MVNGQMSESDWVTHLNLTGFVDNGDVASNVRLDTSTVRRIHDDKVCWSSLFAF